MLLGVIILLYYIINMGSGSFIEDVIYLDIVIGIVGSMVIFLYYRNNIEFSIKVILLLGKRV